MRAPRVRITSALIASTLPVTWPAIMTGPFSTATSPRTVRELSITRRVVVRNACVALKSATTSWATSRGRTLVVSRSCASALRAVSETSSANPAT